MLAKKGRKLGAGDVPLLRATGEEAALDEGDAPAAALQGGGVDNAERAAGDEDVEVRRGGGDGDVGDVDYGGWDGGVCVAGFEAREGGICAGEGGERVAFLGGGEKVA